MPSDGGLQDFISCWQWCNKLDGPNGDEHSYEIDEKYFFIGLLLLLFLLHRITSHKPVTLYLTEQRGHG